MKKMKALKLFTTITVLFLLVILTANNSFAQKPSLYIPRNIVKAYEKGIRSYDGKPGSKYWINHADYKIKAEVFPKERVVKGTEQIMYYNDSPNTLANIVLRLYLDVNKKGNARDESVDPGDETDGVAIDTIIINGAGVNVKTGNGFYRSATNLEIRNLKVPILPHSITQIDVKWSVIIPKETRNRMGAYNDSTLYVAYWYPQVSVYDDIDGWDKNEYGGAVEFYNDKNNFEFEITAPNKYLVWATGVYQNLQDILKPEIYSRYKAAQKADTVIRIVRVEDLKKGVMAGNEKNIWKFKAEGVSDISFATSSGYVWDGVGAIVDSTGRKVFTDAAYPVTSKLWNEVANFAKLSVENLSMKWPGLPFPYPKITVFNGEATYADGMEMPMMCNNGLSSTRESQAGLTLHEIAHNYFPFYMGTNERKYAWMDEGWATYFENALINNIVKSSNDFSGYISYVGKTMGLEYDAPMIFPTIAANGPLEGFNSYTKSAVSYYMLKSILGDDLFRKGLHEFMSRWNGKHPIPWDFFLTFNDVAKEDLSWFWNPWFFEHGFPDLAVKNVKIKRGNVEIDIEKIGNVPVPVDLKIKYVDGSVEEIHRSTTIWRTGNKEAKINLKTRKDVQLVWINTTLVPDANLKNNFFEVREKSKNVTSLNKKNITTQDSIKKVKIGYQVWMTENLNVDRFLNGDVIPEAKTNEEWAKAGVDGKPAWCYYNNDSANAKKFGRLYNWYTVNDKRGIAPKGWHIPMMEDFVVLSGMVDDESTALKAIDQGTGSGAGTNASGFSALLSGGRYSGSSFYPICSFWSASGNSDLTAGGMYMPGNNGSINIYYWYPKEFGFSVRCIKD